MKMIQQTLWIFLFFFLGGSLSAQKDLSTHLEPLRFILDTTWQGKVGESETKEPIYDVSRWERALNGKAIRILHSVNAGDYGGETIVLWDKEKKSLVYYYFTTAEFFTQGTFTVEGSTITSHEYVAGNEAGITEVKSTTELRQDGKLYVKTQMRKKGVWEDRPEVVYYKKSSAKVVFR